MTDAVAEVVQLVLAGVEFADPRLVRLREAMTPEEIAVAVRRLGAAYLKTLPPLPTDSGAPDVTEIDYVGVFIALIQRGARADDVRLVRLMDGMTGEEFARAKAAIGALWLEAEPRPARPH